MKESEPGIAEAVRDGRALRGHRSRQQIIDAALDLCAEGVLVPTAQQVAGRAGVGMRTVFRHFSDMESLFVELDACLVERFRGHFAGGRRDGPLRARIDRLVRRRGGGFDAIAPYVRSTLAQLWSSPVLDENYARFVGMISRDLRAWLPELDAQPATVQAAAEAAASFETWERLRRHQGLAHEAAAQAVSLMLSRLIA